MRHAWRKKNKTPNGVSVSLNLQCNKQCNTCLSGVNGEDQFRPAVTKSTELDCGLCDGPFLKRPETNNQHKATLRDRGTHPCFLPVAMHTHAHVAAPS